MSSDFKPNSDQIDCINKLDKFINENKPFSKLLINGSAGTGKTTILITGIIDIVNRDVMARYDYYLDAVRNEKWELLDDLKHFIIAAPTNKAKDVLVSKYNIFLSSLKNDTTCDRFLLGEILHRRIDFLTVSQVLSISRVINEMGEEEFTKGNEKKIADKYNKPTYSNTYIIIDECSMIDSNTSKVLNVIKCPIIYIGDYCQLPPVNDTLSPIFNIEGDLNSTVIRLMKVERCKASITDIANVLRDKIYETIPDFNLLKYKNTELILYPKKMEGWLDKYVDEIKTKIKDVMQITNKSPSTGNTNIASTNETAVKPIEKISNDSMALAWTNKCCSMLNQKVRNKLFIDSIMNSTVDVDETGEDIEDINEHFIIKGDKLLVKAPYYKYGHNIYSSSIVYIAKLQKTKYKPITFREWCNLAMEIKELKNTNKNKAEPIFDINLEAVLDDKANDKSANNKSNAKSNTKQKSLFDYFNIADDIITTSEHTGEKDCHVDSENEHEKQVKIQKEKDLKELHDLRTKFFIYHNLNDVIVEDKYEFTDNISIKYNNIEGFSLMDIKNENNANERAEKYKKWHQKVCNILFGIPIDRILCRKCEFFINKFASMMNKSCNVADMINATESLELDMYIADLAIFTTTSKYIVHDIPILDMLNKNNIDSISNIRNIVKNSYEVKIPLSKQDENALKMINKIIGEDDASTQKYITMSQMFGHYLNHVITSNYLEVDYGYALTVHKSQGSTYDDVFIEYANLQANKKDTEKYKLLYTAITRSANKLHVYH